MASPVNVRELRWLSGTTFNTTHTNAAAATWAANNATKQRVISFDASGLVYPGEADATLESQLYRGRAHIPLLRNGSLKFGCYLEGAESDATANPLATLLSKIMGGIQNPGTARTDLCEVGCSSTVLNITAHGVETGTAVLVGTRGDSRGNAEVRYATDTNANALTLSTALPVAPNNADAIVYSTTVYQHDTTQQYLDFLAIGKDAKDQVQTIGGMGPFTITDLAPGSVPKVEFDIQVADWQEVSTTAANLDALEPTSASQGNQPAIDRGIGHFMIADKSGTTRAVYKAVDVTITPGLAFEMVPDPNGINGQGGWVRVPSMPTLEATLILEGGNDPLPGMYDDFANGATSTGMTAKEVILQVGHTAQRCCAFSFPSFYFDAAPVRADAGGVAGVKIVGHGETEAHADTAAAALQYSAMSIHFF